MFCTLLSCGGRVTARGRHIHRSRYGDPYCSLSCEVQDNRPVVTPAFRAAADAKAEARRDASTVEVRVGWCYCGETMERCGKCIPPTSKRTAPVPQETPDTAAALSAYGDVRFWKLPPGGQLHIFPLKVTSTGRLVGRSVPAIHGLPGATAHRGPSTLADLKQHVTAVLDWYRITTQDDPTETRRKLALIVANSEQGFRYVRERVVAELLDPWVHVFSSVVAVPPRRYDFSRYVLSLVAPCQL